MALLLAAGTKTCMATGLITGVVKKKTPESCIVISEVLRQIEGEPRILFVCWCLVVCVLVVPVPMKHRERYQSKRFVQCKKVNEIMHCTRSIIRLLAAHVACARTKMHARSPTGKSDLTDPEPIATSNTHNTTQV
jgi:hypothetical protein